MLRIFEAGHQFEDLSIRWLRAAGFDLRDPAPRRRAVRLRDRGRPHPRSHRRRDRRRARHRHQLAGALGTQGAEREVVDRCRQARRRALEAGLLRAAPALHGLHGARGGAVHRAQQGHPGTPPRDRPLRSGRGAGALRQGGRRSFAPRRPASCRRASPPTPTSISAACAPMPRAAGRARA